MSVTGIDRIRDWQALQVTDLLITCIAQIRLINRKSQVQILSPQPYEQPNRGVAATAVVGLLGYPGQGSGNDGGNSCN